MTKHEIERESWWVRLGSGVGRGLYAFSIVAALPSRLAAMSPAYDSSDCPARRKRRQQEGVAR